MKISNFDQVVKQYILDSIDLAIYEESAETPQQAAQKVIDFALNENDYPRNRQLLGSDRAIIADHFRGLPSYFNIAYSNYDILQLAYKWGSISENASDKEKEKITDTYWLFIANKLQQIANGYHVKGLKWREYCEVTY